MQLSALFPKQVQRKFRALAFAVGALSLQTLLDIEIATPNTSEQVKIHPDQYQGQFLRIVPFRIVNRTL